VALSCGGSGQSPSPASRCTPQLVEQTEFSRQHNICMQMHHDTAGYGRNTAERILCRKPEAPAFDGINASLLLSFYGSNTLHKELFSGSRTALYRQPPQVTQYHQRASKSENIITGQLPSLFELPRIYHLSKTPSREINTP